MQDEFAPMREPQHSTRNACWKQEGADEKRGINDRASWHRNVGLRLRQPGSRLPVREWLAPGDADGLQQDNTACRHLRFQVVAFLQMRCFAYITRQRDLRRTAHLNERQGEFSFKVAVSDKYEFHKIRTYMPPLASTTRCCELRSLSPLAGRELRAREVQFG